MQNILGQLASRVDPDIRTITDLWVGADGPMTPSRRADVKHAISALERVAEAVRGTLPDRAQSEVRTLPEISARTRLRQTPRRLWIVVSRMSATGAWREHPELFVEFSAAGVRYGLYIPNGAAGRANARFWKAFKMAAPRIFETIKPQLSDAGLRTTAQGWRIERAAAPADGETIGPGFEGWLSQRAVAARQQNSGLTVSHPCPAPPHTPSEIADRVLDFNALFGALLTVSVPRMRAHDPKPAKT